MGQRDAGRYPYFDADFIALAHRGGACAQAPAALENSLRSFDAAASLGYRHLETDVHATSDGVLIAFHDDRLDRVTDATGVIADLPWSVVSRGLIGGREPIPRFSDLLEALPQARFNLDIKADAATDLLAATLAHHSAGARVCVGSFSTRRIGRFRRLTRGEIATSASPAEVAVFAFGPGLRRRWPLVCQAFQVPEREPRTRVRVVTPGLIAAAHRRGAAVHVWTVNDRAAMESLIDLGVDGLVTDEIALLKQVLQERGMWEGNR
ncbi:MAG: glycerophosphodiester phosphodiesterase family protein [Propioniciclava sp.]